MPPNNHKLSERVALVSGAFFLFGLAWLFYVGPFWPGILLLIAITSVPILLVETGWRMTLWLTAQSTVWLVGLAVLFSTGTIFPGVLVLAGLSALIVAIAPPDQLDKNCCQDQARRKAKHTLSIPVPPYAEDDFYEDDDYIDADGWEDVPNAAYHPSADDTYR